MAVSHGCPAAVTLGLHGGTTMLMWGRVAAGIAGAIRGFALRLRLIYWGAFAVAEAGVIGATALYAQDRTELWHVELLIPMLLGAIPGAVAYLIAAKIQGDAPFGKSSP